jgi:hypothetical protein
MPLRYRPEVAPPLLPPTGEFHPEWFDNREHGAYYDYVLTRGPDDTFRAAIARGGPAWHLTAESGRWKLWARDETKND